MESAISRFRGDAHDIDAVRTSTQNNRIAFKQTVFLQNRSRTSKHVQLRRAKGTDQ
ncbi:hypothetical protein ACFQ2C_00405 [Sphingobacterium daejeonense]|uniref:Uncharacterized protein n=1 Tax=Sphingobacterium daejeonense TaxID=371142 RepID=A0ABW3RGH9_9SPHI